MKRKWSDACRISSWHSAISVLKIVIEEKQCIGIPRITNKIVEISRSVTWIVYDGAKNNHRKNFSLFYLSIRKTIITLCSVVVRLCPCLGRIHTTPSIHYNFRHYLGQCKPYDCIFKPCKLFKQLRYNDARIILNTLEFVYRGLQNAEKDCTLFGDKTACECSGTWVEALLEWKKCNYTKTVEHIPSAGKLVRKMENLTVSSSSHDLWQVYARTAPAVISPFSDPPFGGVYRGK